MSLRDTIEGARREAEGNAAGRPKKEVATVVGDEKKGFSKSSASKARPAREAAASVRTVSSSYKAGAQSAPETKQEKRERRERERSENTLRTRAYDLVLRDNAEYRSCEKTFWIIVGTGTFFAVSSLVETYVFGQNVDLTSWQGVLCVVTLVLAYVFIISALVYDFAKRRPHRKAARARVNGMSDKRLLELFEQEHGSKKD